MYDNDQMRRALQELREEAGVSQAEVAKRLPFTASRVSRLESGDIALKPEEAQEIAKAIGTPRALEFAEYLGQDWQVLESPGFDHVSRPILWQAEVALRRLDDLQDDPDLKNVFLKQVESCREALKRVAGFLAGTEHSIAFIGSPGVGKTTAICGLAKLRDLSLEGLDRQMMLQTGGGRTTICEVHVRYGREYALSVASCSDEEMRQYVAEFCDHIIGLANTGEIAPGEAVGLSAEIDRALRNMTGLTVKRPKGPDGKLRQEDPARELAAAYPNREDLQAQVFSRLDLVRRQRTSVSYSRDSSMTGLHWVSRTFAQINYGRHPEFSLPRRIEVSLPDPILGETKVDLRLIDTRGVDEPKAPRRDLQSYLDDDRAIIVFCSSFKDAPDAAMLDVIDRAVQGGLRQSLVERGTIIVLPQDSEEKKVRDQHGEQASSIEEGRHIKEEQLTGTLKRLGISGLRVAFMDVSQPEDCEAIRDTIVAMVMELRRRASEQIASLVKTVDRLIANKANEQVKAVFEEVSRRIRVWTETNACIVDGGPRVERGLLSEMDSLRYASSLRASVNRRGDWYNFDYWHGLGHGARCEVVARTDKQLNDLKAVIANLRADDDLSEAHGFLEHLDAQFDEAVKNYHLEMQAVGEAAFAEQLREDHSYWSQCRERWGAGPGYKSDIRGWTDRWFSEEARRERHTFIEAEMQRRWSDLLQRISSQVASAGTGGTAGASA